MSFEYELHDSDDLCMMKFHHNITYYAKEIVIYKFSEKTTLEDLRIRFSIYGSIKDCYFDNQPRRAHIIFYEVDSAMNVILNHSCGIYLHDVELTVYGKFANKKTLQTYYENHRGSTSINKLNNDCLLQIFGYLSIVERFNLRKVCTRWCTIANESLRTLRHLYLDFLSEYLIENIYHKQQLRELLRNSKLEYETSLSYYKRYTVLINDIATFTMNLLAMDCRHLTKLIMRGSIYDDDILSRILTRNQNLRHVEVLGNRFITGKSLIHMSEKVHTLRVEQCAYLEASHLRNALMRLKNLKRLVLSDPCISDVLSIFNEYCQNLENLKLNCNYGHAPNFHNNILVYLPITNLKNLRSLEICLDLHITDPFFVNLSKNCQELNRLKLYYVRTISEREMNAIASLTKLQELVILCYETNLANLRGLHKLIILCFSLTEIPDAMEEEKIVTVIQNSPELRCLLIYGYCSIIYMENILSKAKMISASRCNGIMLEIKLVTAYKGSDKLIVRKHVIFNGKIY